MQGPGGDPVSEVRRKCDLYKRTGLDFTGNVGLGSKGGRLHGRLTPEAVAAIGKLHDILAVHAIMEESLLPYVTIEIPENLEAAFEEAFK